MMRPRRDNAAGKSGEVGTAQKSTSNRKHNPFTGYVQAPKPSKNQPSNGAIGNAFYAKLFGKVANHE